MTNTLREFVAEYFDAAVDLAQKHIPLANILADDDTVPWMETAKSHMGLKEIPGRRHEAKIMSWADDIGGWVADYYTSDEIPWCGLFIAGTLIANNIDVTIKNPLSALAYRKQGFHCDPCYGAIMTFTRRGGGHVGYYVSEDDNYYHILGGNQSNKVCVTKVSKVRFKEARWPTGHETLYEHNKGRIHKVFDGKVSIDEA